MVKIPGLDDLKKMGSGLIDSAKTVNLSGVVDKLKTGIESVSKKSNVDLSGDDPLGKLLQEINVVLEELLAANAAQAVALKKIQSHLVAVSNIAATYQKPISTETSEPSPQKPEDKTL